MRHPVITLTTDFGVADHYVGTMKGVILGIAPGARIVDISHEVRPFEIADGAYVIAQAARYFPAKSIHVVVVDPGVGSARRPILAEVEGRYFVAPDNGVLSMIFESLPPSSDKVRHITAERYFLKDVSSTFHGRDIFAPVAAHLATGLAAAELGPEIDPAGLVRLEIPRPRATRRGLRAAAVLIDRFGNVALNLDADRLEAAKLGDPIELLCGGERYLARLARSFVEVRPSDIMVLVDSYGQIAVAVNTGSAEEVLGLTPGDLVELRRLS